MKGIILAGGSGTRLHPITLGISKQLMPVYNKPMIYYPLSTLMHSGINDILIITTPDDQLAFQKLLGDGSKVGCSFQYKIQPEPNGLAQAFTIGAEFIGADKVALILGDNIFFGSDLGKKLRTCTNPEGGLVFAYYINDPKRYGVVDFDKNFNVLSIEEKPKKPKSHYAVPGLYFYNNDVVEIAKNLTPSSRGEYEITDINKTYLELGKLKVEILQRGVAWLDTGTFRSLMQASHYVQTIEERQGLGVGCIEAVAFNRGFIDSEQLEKLATPLIKSGYGQYLLSLLD
jgi:glucose-1-phosphate thymidylyltransferase